jgi:hypothetical protein
MAQTYGKSTRFAEGYQGTKHLKQCANIVSELGFELLLVCTTQPGEVAEKLRAAADNRLLDLCVARAGEGGCQLVPPSQGRFANRPCSRRRCGHSR